MYSRVQENARARRAQAGNWQGFVKKPEIPKIGQELADRLSKLDSPEKERADILARVAEVRARFEAKRKKEDQGSNTLVFPPDGPGVENSGS